VGFAERLRALGPRVLIHEIDAPAATGAEKLKTPKGRPRDLAKPGMVTFLAHALRNQGMRYVHLQEATTFTDGEILDVPGRLRVVHTPGHSPGHCALLMQDRGILFSADGLVTLTPWSGETGPQLMKINADHALARRSLDIYEGLTADVLLPGHGDPWTGDVAEAARTAREKSSALE
jgi:glyoxylase-like metal-dependent hydrolase (beta-lactamase superfamily II)